MRDWSWRDWKDWVWLFGIGGVLSSIVITLGPGWSWVKEWFFSKPEVTASWVQAVGSIAAIGTGFALAAEQRREAAAVAHAEARAAESRLTQAFIGRIVIANQGCRRLKAELQQDHPNWAKARHVFEEVEEAMLHVPAVEIPSPAAAIMLSTFVMPVRVVARKLELCELAAAASAPTELDAVLADVKVLSGHVLRARAFTKGQLHRLLTDAEREAMNAALAAMRLPKGHASPSDQSEIPQPPAAGPAPTAGSQPAAKPGAQV